MKKVLVTGANGQLGQCLQAASKHYPKLKFTFATRQHLDITNQDALEDFFEDNYFDFCINTAAYTRVDQAEKAQEAAQEANATAVKKLAVLCSALNITLLHISTDYVFDGEAKSPYKEDDTTNPLGVYGATKLAGEKAIIESCRKHFIVRSSWLYSQYGANFMKTILKHSAAGKELTITTEQTGTPTNANDLAGFLLRLISEEKKKYGIYHFANKGEGTWYDFASEILRGANLLSTTNLAKTHHYPTFAKRPKYSVLDTGKSEQLLDIEIPHWKDSLQQLIQSIAI